MKKLIIIFALLPILASAQFGKIKIDPAKMTKAAADVATAATLTDAQVAQMSQEYITWMDAHNLVCTNNSKDPKVKAYADRLEKMVKSCTNYEGLTLDIKAYYVIDQNAFACANGSIRVFAGLMDLVTDDQLLGIIGHEVGHIKGGDTKDAMKNAYLVSAGKNAVASAGATAAALTDSQLGGLATALAGASFSQKQEYAADEFGFNFLKNNGKNSKGMAEALRVIQGLQDKAGAEKSKMNALFSSHPDSGKRAERLDKMQ